MLRRSHLCQKIGRRALFLALIFSLAACQLESNKQNSVIVIAVQHLSFDAVSCGGDRFLARELAGFRVFCQEAVRFTHAFTPSILSQPALTSLMTARFPQEHGVWHNGANFLSAQVETVAERAAEEGYQTSFWSGGPPIFSKSGLDQGFDLFVDSVNPSLSLVYKPVGSLVRSFDKWLSNQVREKPFFSMIFVADLQFPDVTTTDHLGEIRERTLESQLREIDESIRWLIESLKERNRWHSTNVILVGLNGESTDQRRNELSVTSLYSSNTQVGLFIKPAQKKRDQGIEWKIDRNVSLVDVGATLFDLIEAPIPIPRGRTLEVKSLKTFLHSPQVNWSQDRMILTESAWPQWREVGTTRFAIRKRQFLYLHDWKPKTFNSLIDRQESTSLQETDLLWEEISPPVFRYLEKNGFTAWSALTDSLVEKVHLARQLFRSSNFEDAVVANIVRLKGRRPWDDQLIQWLSLVYVKTQNWQELLELSLEQKNYLWQFVANKNLNQKVPKVSFVGCERAFVDRSMSHSEYTQICEDSLMVSLFDWVIEEDSDRKLMAQERFLRSYRLMKIDESIQRMNAYNQWRWELSFDLPAGPHIVDLFLQMPEMSRYAAISRSRISRENF